MEMQYVECFMDLDSVDSSGFYLCNLFDCFV